MCPQHSAVYLSQGLLHAHILFLFLPHIKNMLKLLYNGFVDLYGAILPQRPTLASEHALRQEQEIYERTTKSTYPNVIISCLVLATSSSLTFSDRQDLYCLSQATRPTDISHPPFCRYRRGSRPTQGV